MQLVIATQNKGKLKEYNRLLADTGFDIIGLADIGLGDLDVEETGTTFSANALLKAQVYAEASQKLVLADDSGLVVDALDGQPGVYSARYGTPDLDDKGRRLHLLKNMQDIAPAQRTARFVCVIAIYEPATAQSYTVEGHCEGEILTEERDSGHGFGYDALFQPVGFTGTFAELPAEVKNKISHRGHAAAKLPPILAQLKK